MVLINAGSFVMGADDNKPHEGPTHRVTLNSFWIDTHEVTVSQFAGFVKATGYRTEAEDFGWSGVFDMKSGAWRKADGADWRHPDGPASQAGTNEPVCQVSWKDAMTYSTWAGKRLPTEAEWEYAARGGLIRKTFAWGDELRPGGKPVANWWQGVFPEHDTGEDGFVGRSPIGRFPPNGYGLYDMTGNVWEWCADWYDDSYYARSPSLNPEGPAAGKERSMRGGSWMCSENFCSNYRPAGRGSATPDTGLNNLGFRCARDAESSSAPAADGTRP
ncbi:MAG: formylglycine-generating enzyme family protein [Acidobacteria bacterium]|nr:formylglycine-generating enzyme family protein [Acidobacteriota bacterium]